MRVTVHPNPITTGKLDRDLDAEDRILDWSGVAKSEDCELGHGRWSRGLRTRGIR